MAYNPNSRPRTDKAAQTRLIPLLAACLQAARSGQWVFIIADEPLADDCRLAIVSALPVGVVVSGRSVALGGGILSLVSGRAWRDFPQSARPRVRAEVGPLDDADAAQWRKLVPDMVRSWV